MIKYIICFWLISLCSCERAENKKLSAIELAKIKMAFWSDYTKKMDYNFKNFYSRRYDIQSYKPNDSNYIKLIVTNRVYKWGDTSHWQDTIEARNSEKIGDFLIKTHSTLDNFPAQFYRFYNSKNGKHYAWFSLDYGAYILDNDTLTNYLYCSDSIFSAKILQFVSPIYCDSAYYLATYSPKNLPTFDRRTFKTVKNCANKPFTVHSLQNEPFYQDLADIIAESGLSAPIEINPLCQLLQCQYYISCINPTNRQYILSLDSTKEKGNFINVASSFDYHNFLEPMEGKNLDSLALVFGDYKVDSLSEIKQYIKNTKPTLVYLKRSYRASFYNEPYYYFIFYYIDFQPFMPPRLRDMQVVFPRRFGLS